MPSARHRVWLIGAVVVPTLWISTKLRNASSAPKRLPNVATSEQRAAKSELEATIRELHESIRESAKGFHALDFTHPSLLDAPPHVTVETLAKRIAQDLGVRWPTKIRVPERTWLELRRDAESVQKHISSEFKRFADAQQNLAARKIEIGDYEEVVSESVPVPSGPMYFIQRLEARGAPRFGIFELRFEESPDHYLMLLEARLQRLELAESFIRSVRQEAIAAWALDGKSK